jgi:predicted small secreted protein
MNNPFTRHRCALAITLAAACLLSACNTGPGLAREMKQQNEAINAFD